MRPPCWNVWLDSYSGIGGGYVACQESKFVGKFSDAQRFKPTETLVLVTLRTSRTWAGLGTHTWNKYDRMMVRFTSTVLSSVMPDWMRAVYLVWTAGIHLAQQWGSQWSHIYHRPVPTPQPQPAESPPCYEEWSLVAARPVSPGYVPGIKVSKMSTYTNNT